ncbi:MAG: diguanylate cyclase [Alphaproteobacteria bacterium]|uniref:diguanylate cyclase n=1 Tax=Candidatus Nitrobium versatile TaxID=2884831 RepID=A0A953M2I2_9BACT|nr:diguanylate cyclase [Candidatus Nitrobium versatile]
MENNVRRRIGLSVLFTEDEIPAREMIARMLKREVRTLYLAENGQKGLELFLKHSPDIVITDIRMPVMDGLEMAEKIKSINKQTPIIVTTAHDDSDFFLKSIEIGVDRYLLKPVDVFRLGTALREMERTIGIARDLKEKTALLEEYRRAVDESNIVCKTDVQGTIIYVNDEFCKVSGYSKKELLGRNHEMILHEKVQENLIKDLRSTILSKRVWKGILEYRKKNGNSYFADITIVPILGVHEEIMEFIYIGHDVTELIDLTTWLKQLSSTDNLTQIYNRRAFNDLLAAELLRAQRYKTQLSLIMFDIDHFKRINDTFGHMTGDEVLKSLVRIVKGSIRSVDVFARWGGEEFMILAPETDEEATYGVAERLRREVEKHCFDTVGHLTASFGVATFRGEDQADILVKRVDDALYRAKEGGRNRVEVG